MIHPHSHAAALNYSSKIAHVAPFLPHPFGINITAVLFTVS
jgi:hypothetical protein